VAGLARRALFSGEERDVPKHRTSLKAIDPEIAMLAARYDHGPEGLVEVLRTLHTRRGQLSRAALDDVARALRLPAAHVFGVASFYSLLSVPARPERTARVCDGPACWLRGLAVPAAGPEWTVTRNSCLGLCDRAPAALVEERQRGPLADGWTPDDGPGGPSSIAPAGYGQPRAGELRVMLARAGKVDPDSWASALAYGAYQALERALAGPREQVLDVVEASGLTGRGGAGFPAGRKWRMVAQAPGTSKYVVCNADESEPLVFKDRVLIDSDPHQLLEGMALAAYAIGAHEGFIYIRGEYAGQAARLEHAIVEAAERGYLGERIRDTDFSFHVRVHRGAGAYICGEETALLDSLEGRRGEPRRRPPYPTTHGYRGRPTLVNNVETYCAAPAIVLKGADWYRGLSRAETPGTKLYMLLGHVRNPGLFEAPFGLTLRRIVDEFGGGMRDGSTLHFALAGGAAGLIVPPALLDVPIDYSSFARGVTLGAGAFLICDQSVSPVALLRELMHFFAAESCGKCTPCRIGTRVLLERLTRMAAGDVRPDDAAELARLANLLQAASFCGLGQSAALPLKSALQHFAADFAPKERS
jgi:NADH:ubiquinone oxidoreductase subunit F (NADH-binding)/NADH:ubiquinone oxidoreductase subunit E